MLAMRYKILLITTTFNNKNVGKNSKLKLKLKI